MSLPVFLSPAVTGVEVGAVLELDGDEGRHAALVKRIRAGEEIELTDGTGTRARVVVESVGKGSLTATVVDVLWLPAAKPALTVVQAIPKGDRGELAVEMLTEVGVDTIVPWAASRCVAVWKGERAAKAHGKWVTASRTAAKQARRAHWPVVSEMAGSEDVVGLIAGADLAVVLHEAADTPLASLPTGVENMLVVVGPEGGLADEEIRSFRDAGAHVVRLGDSVLRTSTAGVVGAAALLSRTKRWM